jgi:peptidyl-prolyl cis-trans isomerase D
MLLWIRKLQESWIARIFFGLLILGFVFWGASSALTLMSANTAVATVDGQPIQVTQVQDEYQRALAAASKGGQPDPATRQQIAQSAMGTVLREALLTAEERHLHISVPDAAVRQAIQQIPAFQTAGAFDQAKFNQVLANNNTTADRFIGEVKADIADRQLVTALQAGVAPPTVLDDRLFAFVAEQRYADTIDIAAAAQTPPPAPGTDVLQRYWKNHQSAFAAPEYRQIQAVILSPALMAADQSIPAAAVDAAYARVAGTSPSVPVRSVDVLVVPDLAASSRLQAAWSQGESWAQMQIMAKKFGATPIQLTRTARNAIPVPALASAVFAAPSGEVTGPIAGSMGLYVFKVTAIASSGPDETAEKARILAALQLQAAQAQVAHEVDGLQDALAGQTPLDKLPGNLGLQAVQGTLDAQGLTMQGKPAPVPGGPAMLAAITKAAFAATPHQPPQLVNGPDGSYFAVQVDKITPPGTPPYDLVQSQVLAAWIEDALTREAEQKATALLGALNAGQNFASVAQSAQAAGTKVGSTGPITRNAPPSGVTGQMVQVLFSLKAGQATMLQTGTGFTVAQLSKIVRPSPADDAQDYQEVQDAMRKSLQDDVGQSLLAGLQARYKVTVNQKLLSQVAQ